MVLLIRVVQPGPALLRFMLLPCYLEQYPALAFGRVALHQQGLIP